MIKKEKQSLANIVYEKLKDFIVFGNLKAGEIVTVGEMAELFNVSNTPVREAFNKLIHNGFLEVLPYKGYIVSQLNLKELEDLFTIRTLLEGGAAELAALTASNKGIEKLESLASVQFSPNDKDSEVTFMKINFKFHITIAEVTDNQLLVEMITNTIERIQRVLYLDLKVANPYSMSEEHTELVQLIKRRDAMGARNKMISHIEASRKRIFNKNKFM